MTVEGDGSGGAAHAESASPQASTELAAGDSGESSASVDPSGSADLAAARGDVDAGEQSDGAAEQSDSAASSAGTNTRIGPRRPRGDERRPSLRAGERETTGSEAEAPTVPMERFVLPRDREAARAALRRDAGGKADTGSLGQKARPGDRGAPDEATARSRRRGGVSTSVAGVVAADATPGQQPETNDGADSATRAPAVKPKQRKNGLFDVEQEGWG